MEKVINSKFLIYSLKDLITMAQFLKRALQFLFILIWAMLLRF